MKTMKWGGDFRYFLDIERKSISLKHFSIFDGRVRCEQRSSKGQRHVEFIKGRRGIFYKL